MHPSPLQLGGGVKNFKKIFAGAGVRNFYFGAGGNFVGGGGGGGGDVGGGGGGGHVVLK